MSPTSWVPKPSQAQFYILKNEWSTSWPHYNETDNRRNISLNSSLQIYHNTRKEKKSKLYKHSITCGTQNWRSLFQSQYVTFQWYLYFGGSGIVTQCQEVKLSLMNKRRSTNVKFKYKVGLVRPRLFSNYSCTHCPSSHGASALWLWFHIFH